MDVTVNSRVRYFDKSEGELFDRMLAGAIADVGRKFPNVKIEVVADELQYENVAYTLHPQAQLLVENAASKVGMDIKFADERGGTTSAMMARADSKEECACSRGCIMCTLPASMPTFMRWRRHIRLCLR